MAGILTKRSTTKQTGRVRCLAPTSFIGTYVPHLPRTVVYFQHEGNKRAIVPAPTGRVLGRHSFLHFFALFSHEHVLLSPDSKMGLILWLFRLNLPPKGAHEEEHMLPLMRQPRNSVEQFCIC